MPHHTKDKGDRGVGFVIADLMRHGLHAAALLSEHLPYDCIAISSDGAEVRRVSVKYRSAFRGCVNVALVSVWADRNGTHRRLHRPGDYDAVAIYCPDTGDCYYVLAKEAARRGIHLRLTPAMNGQRKKVKPANEYRDPRRLFLGP